MNQVTVKAKEGARCPREENPRKYIADNQAVEVALTPYYKRLLRDGSLIEVKKQVKNSALKKRNGGKS